MAIKDDPGAVARAEASGGQESGEQAPDTAIECAQPELARYEILAREPGDPLRCIDIIVVRLRSGHIGRYANLELDWETLDDLVEERVVLGFVDIEATADGDIEATADQAELIAGLPVVERLLGEGGQTRWWCRVICPLPPRHRR
jgi:hypothetical protein